MINAILKGIFSLITDLVGVLLSPIDSIISSALPGLQSALNAIGQFLTLITSALGWVLSVFGLPNECLSLIVLYFTFKLTVPLTIYAIKLAVKWYHMLVP